jgi:hypothetical protein
MRVVPSLLLLSSVALCSLRADEPEKKFVSGPQAGEPLAGSFDSRIISGPFAGKQHCLVCENRLFPVLMVFVREPEAPKEWKEDGPIRYLMNKLEAAVDTYHDKVYLKSFVVFLSPYARSSATEEGKREAKDLVEEARNRELLLKNLTERAKKSDKVVLAAFAKDGPKDYKLNPEAEVTIIFFHKLKVLRNEAFPEDKMTKEDVDRFMESVEATIKSWRGKAAEPKKVEPKKVDKIGVG